MSKRSAFVRFPLAGEPRDCGLVGQGDRAHWAERSNDEIIAAIERGAGEFRLPWHRSAGKIMRHVASRKPYRGVNILTLWAAADELGYTSGMLGTCAQVRKGEKAAYIVFYKEITVASDDADSDECETPPFCPRDAGLRRRAGGRLCSPCPRRPHDLHYADRAGRSLCRLDRCHYPSRPQPRLLSPLDRQHSVTAARGFHRQRNQYARRVL
jgi:N-terminal domain of anti-restriction factor ArdC